jgi:hypothetical protein
MRTPFFLGFGGFRPGLPLRLIGVVARPGAVGKASADPPFQPLQNAVESFRAGQGPDEAMEISAVAGDPAALLVAVAGHRRGLLAWLKEKGRQNRALAS